MSQTINLAFMYASLRRPREAAAQLSELDGTPSAYGRMQVERVRVLVAIANNDDGAMRKALDNLRSQQEVSPMTFQKALLDANQLDEAAALLIRRLREPSLRVTWKRCRWISSEVTPTPIMATATGR